MKKSIRVKLVVIMLLVSAVPLLVSNILTNTRTNKIVTQSFESSNLEIVKGVEYGISNKFDTYKSAIEIFANMDSTKDLVRKPYEQYGLKKDLNTYIEQHEDVVSFYVYKRNESTGWFVLVIMNQSEVSTILSPIKVQSQLILVVCLIATTIMAVLLAIKIVKPIISLEKSMKVVQDGDLSIRTEILTKDELGTIAVSFNIMLDHFSTMLGTSKEVANQVSLSAEKANKNGVIVIEELRAQSNENEKTTLKIENAVNKLEKKSMGEVLLL